MNEAVQSFIPDTVCLIERGYPSVIKGKAPEAK